MGVWIETTNIKQGGRQRTVTPCMGVWIETYRTYRLHNFQQSHPVWVCGLKLSASVKTEAPAGHTLYGCVD